MKKSIAFTLSIISLVVLVFSCQRELALEMAKPSEGTLQKDSAGNCGPVTIGGRFVNGKALGDTNYLEVTINVTLPGAYTIYTDTVNGYWFSAAGNFAGSGLARVRLAGAGSPLTADIDDFTVRYNASICNAAVTVRSNAIAPAVFTLSGSPNSCMNDTIYGSYVKGTALDTSSKIKISLNVTATGTYAISTDTVNGYSFSTTGTFTVTGVQHVLLTASGAPTNPGTDVFTVKAGSSRCGFSLMVLTAVPITGTDYFPLTSNSFWTYDNLLTAGDTLKRTVTDTTTINNAVYKMVREDVKFGAPNQYVFRKSGPEYFEYAPMDKYTKSFKYKKVTNVNLPFLKENLFTGNFWQSAEFTDTASFGQVLKLRYEYTCLDGNATITLNGKAFTNVYKIEVRPFLRTLTDPWGATGEVHLFYYAKGIGLIYYRQMSQSFVQADLQIRRWQVN